MDGITADATTFSGHENPSVKSLCHNPLKLDYKVLALWKLNAK